MKTYLSIPSRLIAFLFIVCVIQIDFCDAQTPNSAKRNSLSQFVYETAMNRGAKAAKQVLEKHRESERFYLDQDELFKTSHLLFQSGRKKEHATLIRLAAEQFPAISNSLANNLFDVARKKGMDAAIDWVKNASDDQYKKQFEFELVIDSFLSRKEFAKAQMAANVFLESFPQSLDAHEKLAEVQMKRGDRKSAMATWRKGLTFSERTTFFSLAAEEPTSYQPTTLPEDPTELYKVSGNPDSDIAFVFVQGGPDPDFGVYRHDPLTLLPGADDIMRVNVRESQMLNPGILSASPVMTEKQALFEHNQSAEILHRTVAHLKSLGKNVYVIGHSYGCMIGLEYLHSKPNLADKVILMGSDPDEDLRNYPDALIGTGTIIRWVDGVEPYEKSFFGRFSLEPLMSENLKRIFTNTDLLVSAHAKRRFTKLLKGKDLSNVIFAYGKFDESNGRPKDYELKFLEDHGATVVEAYGDHHSMLSATFLNNLFHHLTDNQPLKTSVASELANRIESGDIKQAIEWYKNEKGSNKYHSINQEEINFLGYQLIKEKKLDEAIAIFQLNVDEFPDSWNVHDSLGEAYMAKGDFESAEISYRQSLVLHPGNGFGIAALKRIKDTRETVKSIL